jgi:hypothetical protein
MVSFMVESSRAKKGPDLQKRIGHAQVEHALSLRRKQLPDTRRMAWAEAPAKSKRRPNGRRFDIGELT